MYKNLNCLKTHWMNTASNETLHISNIHQPVSNDECINIAPDEGKQPKSVLSDEFCEELDHPYLFPTGKFGHKVKGNVTLSPVKYFNQPLLNYIQKFTSDSDYIFLVHSVLQQIALQSQINVTVRKVTSASLNAGVINKDFKQFVQQSVASDQAYTFMSSIKGTPAYWKKFISECLAMVRQLGVSSFFLTLSCVDLRWDELVSIISKLNFSDLNPADVSNLSYYNRCDILNSNPVLVARHFQYRVEHFLKLLIANGPLGKTKY